LFTICIQKYGVDTKILGDIFTIREQNAKKGMIKQLSSEKKLIMENHSIYYKCAGISAKKEKNAYI